MEIFGNRTDLVRVPASARCFEPVRNSKLPACTGSRRLRCLPLPRLARAASSRASGRRPVCRGDPGVAVQARGQHRAVAEQVDLAGEQVRIGRPRPRRPVP